MKISIITPTFNDVSFLERTIESLLAQSYRNFEHIIVDGGSTDGTMELLKSYPHIKWISEPDNGMYDAINKGINMASGQIITYLNSDDRYPENTLQLVYEQFQQKKDVDFVYGYCTYIDENEKKICTFKPVPFWKSMARKARITWVQPCCFWRKNVQTKIGLFDGDMKISGDADFFHRILSDGGKGMLIRKPLAYFMARKDCISNLMTDNYKIEGQLVKKKYGINSKNWQYFVTEGIYWVINLVSLLKYQVAKRKNRV